MGTRIPPLLLAAGLLLGPGAALAGPALQVEIHEPPPLTLLPAGESSVEVVGGASIFGGVRYLDLFLVIDTSKSLQNTDPEDQRLSGAIGLIRSLPDHDSIRVGVVEFDGDAETLLSLTSDREATIRALEGLDQQGTTNLAEGIRAALHGFDARPRLGASPVILLFTDGRTNTDQARVAGREAQLRGVAVHSLLLGSDEAGEVILRRIAGDTGGNFVRVTDPELLPEAFLDLRATGIERVVVRTEDGEPVIAELSGGRFTARVPVRHGSNRIVATARSLSGQQRQAEVEVLVGSACGELQVEAVRAGAPTLHLSERSIEFLFDASNSMWGRMEGEPKIDVAKRILGDTLRWLPRDLAVGLRVYGHQKAHSAGDCRDSELLVPVATDSRDPIRQAIAGFRPRGQTPLAFSLQQVARDLETAPGERIVVLVTDGIESCGGDPVAAARELQSAAPTPVHVIGFGLSGDAEDEAALRSIAQASGGSFVLAANAAQLREALALSVGTPFAVRQGDETVARGNLGSRESVSLPEGEYTLRLESRPPYEVPLSMASRQALRLVLEPEERGLRLRRLERPTDLMTCADGIAVRFSPQDLGEGQTLPAAPDPGAL